MLECWWKSSKVLVSSALRGRLVDRREFRRPKKFGVVTPHFPYVHAPQQSDGGEAVRGRAGLLSLPHKRSSVVEYSTVQLDTKKINCFGACFVTIGFTVRHQPPKFLVNQLM